MKPKRLAIADLDKYRKSLGDDVVYVNDLALETEEDQKNVIDRILTHYITDHIPAVKPADSPFMQKRKPSVWLRPPDGVKKYVVPRAWLMLRKGLTYKGVSVLRWLTDPLYRVNKDPMGPWLALVEAGVERSYSYFVDNFDFIMEIWFNYFLGLKRMEDKDRDFFVWVKMYKDVFFPDALPIPDRMAFVRETNSTGDYGDVGVMTPAIDAVATIASIGNMSGILTKRRAEAKTVKVIENLAEFISRHDKLNSSKKSGVYRKHFCGASMSFSSRTIITSIQNTPSMILDKRNPYNVDYGLKYDEIHIPWGMGLELFKIHISVILQRRGYSPIDIANMYARHTRYPSDLLREVMNEVITSHPLGRFPCLVQRNPSLKRGSTQMLFITRVKDDPRDNSLSLSNLVITAPNADYDGDETNQYLCLDERMYSLAAPLQPHFGIRDLYAPRRYCNHMQIPKPSIATLSAWNAATACGLIR